MKVKEFSAPFGLIPELRLSVVSRWGIISMSRHQSVAEHSFGVAVIVEYLCDAIDLINSAKMTLVMEALHHDSKEVYTGDIPSPAKKKKGRCGTHYIVKLADVIESYRYAMMYINDTPAVEEWLLIRLAKEATDLAREARIPHDIWWPLMQEAGS